jgi:hypothetical protein
MRLDRFQRHDSRKLSSLALGTREAGNARISISETIHDLEILRFAQDDALDST